MSRNACLCENDQKFKVVLKECKLLVHPAHLFTCTYYAYTISAHFTIDTSQYGRSHKLTNYRLKRDKKIFHRLCVYTGISWNTQHNKWHHGTETT